MTFLLSQYADDSSLVLEDDPQSLDNSIKLFHKFMECAGLRMNIDKTEAQEKDVQINYCQN